MDTIREKLACIVPKYSVVPLIFSVSFNMLVYVGSRLVAGDWRHYNIEGPLDRMVPLWPPSVVIYLGCYLFWIANYILIARQGKREVCQFFSADFISRVVCLAFYLIFPTTNVRPVVEPAGFWNQALLFLYAVDAPDNLFPSIHCLVSWFCYIGLRKRNEVCVWYRAFSYVMAILVCASTLLTKQHVVIDVCGGILLAEICFWLGKKQAVWQCYEHALDWVNQKIFTQ